MYSGLKVKPMSDKKFQGQIIQVNAGTKLPETVIESKGKNISSTIKNGTFIITRDDFFYGTDGNSTKTRMATVVDSNQRDELGITKYTTSTVHGTAFNNKQGFAAYGDRVYTLDDQGNPIKIDGNKFKRGNPNRDITVKQANQIKKSNIKDSPYGEKNKKRLRNLKGR